MPAHLHVCICENIKVLSDYAAAGGVWGILDPTIAKDNGTSPAHYLSGNGTRTVVMTMSHLEHRAVDRMATSRSPPRVIYCEAGWAKGVPPPPTSPACNLPDPEAFHTPRRIEAADSVSGWFGFEYKE